MPPSSPLQTSFLGGEWSPSVQGRAERRDYATALNVCRNALPIEQGSWNRRPGTRYGWHTRGGAKGRVIAYPIEENAPYLMEFTDGYLRLGSGARGYLDLASTNDAQTVLAISTANPAVVQTKAAHGWSTGNTVKFLWAGAKNSVGALLQGRQFVITKTDATHFSLADALTGASIDGSTLSGVSAPSGLSVMRVLEFAAPYAGTSWSSVRAVNCNINGVSQAALLHGSYRPQVLAVETMPSTGQDATFTLSAAQFRDGPYLDPVQDSTCQVIGTSGVIQIFIAFQDWATTSVYNTGDRVLSTASQNEYMSLIDGNTGLAPENNPTAWEQLPDGEAVKRQGGGFQQSDVGRHVRIFAEPLAWNSATSYGPGDVAGFNGIYYSCLVSNTNVQPDQNLSDWAVNPTAAVWVWGVITGIKNTDNAYVALDSAVSIPTVYNEFVFSTWQLGLYGGAETGWPTCGCFHEGRLWLAGAVANRFDASNSNDIWNFAPTDSTGVVADSNAISETLNASDQNPIYWMEPTDNGIVCGTQAGEWLLQASQLSDPLTPTSIQAHRKTRYGCANIEPARAPLTLGIVQKHQRKLLEYFPDVFSGRFQAPNLTETANHLTTGSIEEVRYQEELAPVIWARCGDGTLIGATYRRTSLFSSQGPEFVGWHRHDLGSGRTVQSITVGPSIDGTLDSLAMVTLDSGTSVYHVETLTDIFDPNAAITEAWFVDDSVVPGPNGAHGGTYQTVGTTPTVVLTGLWHLNGKKVSVWLCGADAGDFTVSDGAVTVALSTDPNALLNRAALGAASIAGVSYGALAVTLDNLDDTSGTTSYTVPCVVGFTYTSQGQRLRDLAPAAAGTPLGPALGKTRRAHMFSALLANTQGVSFGTDFTTMHAAAFKSAGGTTSLTAKQLFSGVYWDTLESSYDFNAMLAWQVTRPYPAIICAAGPFQQAQER